MFLPCAQKPRFEECSLKPFAHTHIPSEQSPFITQLSTFAEQFPPLAILHTGGFEFLSHREFGGKQSMSSVHGCSKSVTI